MLCEKIKEYICDNGIKLSYIAEKANIPNQVFSAMLNGKRSIKAEEYFDICNALNVSVEKFADIGQGAQTRQ